MSVFSANHDVIGLHEYGHVGAPGISDLDLLAILRDDATGGDDLLGLLTGESAPEHVVRVLDAGDIKPMSARHFAEIRILGQIRARPLFSEIPVEPLELSEPTQKLVDIANVIDWLPERILMIRRYLGTAELPARRVLGLLGSLRHSLRAAARVMEDDAIAKPMSTPLDALRSGWFQRDEAENLLRTVSLLRDSVNLGRRVMDRFAEFVVDQGHFAPRPLARDACFFIDESRALVARGDRQNAALSSDAVGLTVEYVPSLCLSQLRLYSSRSGHVGDLIRANLDDDDQINETWVAPQMAEVLVERVRLCNSMAEFLTPLGLARQMYRFAHLRRGRARRASHGGRA